MFEFAKKTVYLGLGLACYTREKLEGFAKEFAERTNMTEEEGRKFADFLNKESDKARSNLKDTVEGMMESMSDRMPCIKKLEAIEARLAALEDAVNRREASAEQADDAASGE